MDLHLPTSVSRLASGVRLKRLSDFHRVVHAIGTHPKRGAR
jgi:hypothetical protein